MPETSEEIMKKALDSIKTVRLSTIDDVLKMLNDQQFDEKIHRHRSPYFYRGLANSSYNLTTTIQRNCGKQQTALEDSILRNFAKYAADVNPNVNKSVWTQLTLGQHHGLPTRLMDWSYSPLVGLHFAVDEGNPAELSKHDCTVWRINNNDLLKTLPPDYLAELDNAFVYTLDMINSLAPNLARYDTDMKAADSMVMIEPPSIDQRIINQYSYFTVIPAHITCVEDFFARRMPDTVRYVIDKDIRWELRDLLDHMNINARIIYPGLDGIAKWLTSYYYVKEK